MQVDVELQQPYNYSYWPMIISAGLVILGLIIFLIFRLIARRKPKNKIIIRRPPASMLVVIKNKYLYAINKIEIDIKLNNISSRKGYRELSSVIRLFIFDVTGIKVQNYTLNEIRVLQMPVLTELVSEYYSPEFSKEGKGNILESINKTRGVIQRWR